MKNALIALLILGASTIATFAIVFFATPKSPKPEPTNVVQPTRTQELLQQMEPEKQEERDEDLQSLHGEDITTIEGAKRISDEVTSLDREHRASIYRVPFDGYYRETYTDLEGTTYNYTYNAPKLIITRNGDDVYRHSMQKYEGPWTHDVLVIDGVVVSSRYYGTKGDPIFSPDSNNVMFVAMLWDTEYGEVYRVIANDTPVTGYFDSIAHLQWAGSKHIVFAGCNEEHQPTDYMLDTDFDGETSLRESYVGRNHAIGCHIVTDDSQSPAFNRVSIGRYNEETKTITATVTYFGATETIEVPFDDIEHAGLEFIESRKEELKELFGS